ncbi:MAG: GNAT family N-acetyltransferase [Ardenticatenaceae bacterium]
MAIQIRPLRKKDNRKEFKSRQAQLDRFFHRYASQNQFRHNIGVTYIATDEESIYGYVTVATGSIEKEILPKGSKLPRNYPLPILRLGRMAVDARYQGQGIGKMLLRYVFLLALKQKELVGCVGIVVDAKQEAIAFYQKYGFQMLSKIVEGEVKGHPSSIPMFLSIKSIPALA